MRSHLAEPPATGRAGDYVTLMIRENGLFPFQPTDAFQVAQLREAVSLEEDADNVEAGGRTPDGRVVSSSAEAAGGLRNAAKVARRSAGLDFVALGLEYAIAREPKAWAVDNGRFHSATTWVDISHGAACVSIWTYLTEDQPMFRCADKDGYSVAVKGAIWNAYQGWLGQAKAAPSGNAETSAAASAPANLPSGPEPSAHRDGTE